MALKYANGNYYGFDILFASTVKCEKNTKYEIRAVISGPFSWKGSDGDSSVFCPGVTFTFTNNVESFCTSSRIGQFPEKLFSVSPPNKDLK